MPAYLTKEEEMAFTPEQDALAERAMKEAHKRLLERAKNGGK